MENIKKYNEFVNENTLIGKKVSIDVNAVKNDLSKVLFNDGSVNRITLTILKDMLTDVDVVSETNNKVTVILKNGKRLTVKKTNLL